MIDQQIRELIQGELDNSNSPSESQELHKVLAADPKAAAYFRELKELDTMMRSGAQVEPPKELKSDIMARIAQERAGVYAEPIPVWTLLRKRITPQTTAIFSVGLAAGLAFFFIFNSAKWPSLSNQDNLYGTIASPETTYQFRTVSEGDVRGEAASAHVVTKAADGMSLVDISMTEGSDVTVTVDFDPNTLSFRGFNQSLPATNRFSVSGGTIQFVNNGSGHYTFLFESRENNAGNVTVRIAQDGVVAGNSFPVK